MFLLFSFGVTFSLVNTAKWFFEVLGKTRRAWTNNSFHAGDSQYCTRLTDCFLTRAGRIRAEDVGQFAANGERSTANRGDRRGNAESAPSIPCVVFLFWCVSSLIWWERVVSNPIRRRACRTAEERWTQPGYAANRQHGQHNASLLCKTRDVCTRNRQRIEGETGDASLAFRWRFSHRLEPSPCNHGRDSSFLLHCPERGTSSLPGASLSLAKSRVQCPWFSSSNHQTYEHL